MTCTAKHNANSATCFISRFSPPNKNSLASRMLWLRIREFHQTLQRLTGGARLDRHARAFDSFAKFRRNSGGHQSRRGIYEDDVSARSRLALQDAKQDRGIFRGIPARQRFDWS